MHADLTPQIEPDIGTPWPDKIERHLQRLATQIADPEAHCADLSSLCQRLKEVLPLNADERRDTLI